jgi:HD superfamily phosphohydrolase
VDEIRNVFSEKVSPGKNLVWKLLVSGQMDADRMDYLLRDSLRAGVNYGRYDLDRIAATVTLPSDKDAVPSHESLLFLPESVFR